MSRLIEALGLVLVLEGLVLALLPRRLDEVLEALRRIPPERRRIIGLGVVAAGVGIVYLVRLTTS